MLARVKTVSRYLNTISKFEYSNTVYTPQFFITTLITQQKDAAVIVHFAALVET